MHKSVNLSITKNSFGHFVYCILKLLYNPSRTHSFIYDEIQCNFDKEKIKGIDYFDFRTIRYKGCYLAIQHYLETYTVIFLILKIYLWKCGCLNASNASCTIHFMENELWCFRSTYKLWNTMLCAKQSNNQLYSYQN